MTKRQRPLMIVFFGIPFLLHVVQFWYRYKHRQLDNESPRDISDNFPEAPVLFNSRLSIPLKPHIQENTTLFIGFSENWLILQQCVVSYIAAGWPPSDIYVIDNTGTFLSNRHRKLSINNPSYLDYTRLENVLGVNIIVAPTRLSFSQLQNFFLSEAISRRWSHFFWSHANAVALSIDRSLYTEAVADFRLGLQDPKSWAIRFYAHDHLALVSVHAFESVGGWDTHIPFYPVDCDMYERLGMAGYISPSPVIGHIYHVASALDNLAVFFNLTGGSSIYDALEKELDGMMAQKNKKDKESNVWQEWHTGGIGEPYYYSREGTRRSQAQMIATGRKIYRMKWGTKECRLQSHGRTTHDLWAQRSWFGMD